MKLDRSAGGRFSGLNENLKALLLAVLIALLNIAAVFLFRVSGELPEDVYISGLSFAVSLIAFLIHIPFCIILRTTRQSVLLRAIFIYQAVAVVAYILFFAGYIGGGGRDNWLTGFFTIFSWWTVGYRNLMLMLARFTGIPFKFTGAVIFMIHTYITASFYIAAKKDIRYEEERRKEAEYIASTKDRH